MMKQKRQRGFALIELLLVVSIMSIGTGTTGMTFGTVYGSYVNECAVKLEAYMSKVHMDSLVKQGEVVLKVYKNADGVHAALIEVTFAGNGEGAPLPSLRTISMERIGGPKANIRCGTDIGEGFWLDEHPIYISYTRSGGALRTLDYAAKLLGADPSPAARCTVLQVVGGTKSVSLTIQPETGRIARMQ